MLNNASDLLSIVRNHLDITWEDPQMDEKIESWIQDGMARIDYYAGENLEYVEPSSELGARRPRELLLAYCRYARSDALDQFESNYSDELRGFRRLKEVRRLETDTEGD